MYRQLQYPGNFLKTDRSSTGWYNLNSATGFANVSTVVFFGLHGHYADVNMSNLDIFGLGNYRYDGKIYGAGISYGYHWILKNRWSMEATIGADIPAWTMTNTHVASVVKSWGTTTRIISDRPKSDSASFIPSSKRPAFTGTNYKKLNQQ